MVQLQWIGEGGDQTGVPVADAAGTRKQIRLVVASPPPWCC